MAANVSDFLIERLHAWGIRRIYGYPGDGINGILGALQRSDDGVRFIQVRHEELAAFMACADAKFTGQIGVCLATSGPGAIHLLNGLYDAKKDNMPVLAIVGQQATLSLGSEYQQEVNLASMFEDVADYVQTAVHPAQVRTLIDQSIRIATAHRAVTCIILPNDLQEQDAVPSAPRTHGCVYSGIGYSPPRIIPEHSDLERAADILNKAERVAILVGAGATGATDEVTQTAERLGAGVAKALLGKNVIPDDVPYCTGSIGLLGTKPSYELMNDCDALFMIGSNFPYSEWLPEDGSVPGVQIDLKPRHLNLRYPMQVPLHGDSKLTLQALLPLLKPKTQDKWRNQIEENVADWWKLMEQRARLDADPINPQLLFWELSQRLPDNAIITADSGSAANWYARDLKVRRGMLCTLSGGLATMCPGVPYAVAGKFAHPDRPAFALVGDGAMQMLGINCLITVARHWREWTDPRLIVCVLNNGDLNQVTWEQRVLAGDPKFEASQDLPPFSYADFARQLGFTAIEVTDPAKVGEAWDTALASDRPTLIDAHTDPDVPPLPPHIKFDQAKGFLFSMLKGDTDAAGVTKQSFKAMAESWLPGSSS